MIVLLFRAEPYVDVNECILQKILHLSISRVFRLSSESDSVTFHLLCAVLLTGVVSLMRRRVRVVCQSAAFAFVWVRLELPERSSDRSLVFFGARPGAPSVLLLGLLCF